MHKDVHKATWKPTYYYVAQIKTGERIISKTLTSILIGLMNLSEESDLELNQHGASTHRSHMGERASCSALAPPPLHRSHPRLGSHVLRELCPLQAKAPVVGTK